MTNCANGLHWCAVTGTRDCASRLHLFAGGEYHRYEQRCHLNLAVGKFGQRALAQVLSRELWPAGIHVAHVVIDADILETDSFDDRHPHSDPGHIAQSVLAVHRQPKTAWTSEMDLRPWNEKFWEHC